MSSGAPRGNGLLPPGAYAREDESPDGSFYGLPRKVVHIDDGAIVALGRLYADVLPGGGRLLDLMSSWRSHLPAELRPSAVVGLGLNTEEMADNPQLTRAVVHDLNRDGRLPFADEEFDGAMCAVSIQYVVHPLRVFRDSAGCCGRGRPRGVVLQPVLPHQGGRLWLSTTDAQHRALVRSYFDAAGGWTGIEDDERVPAGGGDPLYAVWACRD